MLLDIDLSTTLMYLGSQVGMENQLNIDPIRHRKNDAKKQGTKMANKTIFDSRGGGRTNFRDLDPVWGRERERVNRDALTRLKTPGEVGG